MGSIGVSEVGKLLFLGTIFAGLKKYIVNSINAGFQFTVIGFQFKIQDIR